MFEEAGILERLEFGDGRARYEDAERDHHDHLIDMNSGEVIEFVDAEIEALQEKIAAKLGYELRGHRLEFIRRSGEKTRLSSVGFHPPLRDFLTSVRQCQRDHHRQDQQPNYMTGCDEPRTGPHCG